MAGTGTGASPLSTSSPSDSVGVSSSHAEEYLVASASTAGCSRQVRSDSSLGPRHDNLEPWGSAMTSSWSASSGASGSVEVTSASTGTAPESSLLEEGARQRAGCCSLAKSRSKRASALSNPLWISSRRNWVEGEIWVGGFMALGFQESMAPVLIVSNPKYIGSQLT